MLAIFANCSCDATRLGCVPTLCSLPLLYAWTEGMRQRLRTRKTPEMIHGQSLDYQLINPSRPPRSRGTWVRALCCGGDSVCPLGIPALACSLTVFVYNTCRRPSRGHTNRHTGSCNQHSGTCQMSTKLYMLVDESCRDRRRRLIVHLHVVQSWPAIVSAFTEDKCHGQKDRSNQLFQSLV